MSTTLQNPYAAILSAIWGIIKMVSQGTGNTLADWLSSLYLFSSQHYEYITDNGAGNPLGLLHPECKRGV